jgi:uroporphyrin-III C-methyltransferase/precorrin-2 dehydrogenase/sirohydrochlorin ferrochelatase
MEKLARLPVFFALEGRRAVVAGGNAAAAWKAELLSAAGATVDVFAEQVGAEMGALGRAPPRGIFVHRRAWRAADLAGAAIAVGAFARDREAESFAAAARAAGVPVNVVDRPAFCDFSFGAIVNRSPLVIGISTDGAAPVFAQAVRAKLEAFLPAGFAAWASAAQRWRTLLQASNLSRAARRRWWEAFTAHAMRHPDATPTQARFDQLVGEVRAEGAAVQAGGVTLVGAGPGDPELLTLRAVRALQSADVILFDARVAVGILDFARREARKMLVETGRGPFSQPDEVMRLMVSLARRGKRVVRLKGGDPLASGDSAADIAACRAAAIAVEAVPGIAAVQGSAPAAERGLSNTRGAA